MRTLYFVFSFLLSGVTLFSQPINDECLTAFHLSNTTNWCSEPAAYTNVNATPFSGNIPPSNCFLSLQNEVWFTFIPSTPAIYIRVSGAVNGLGTMSGPGIAIFEGPCNNLNRIGCNLSSSITNQVELAVDNLVTGRVYYLVVESPAVSPGSFQICIEGFIPPPQPQSDCNSGVILCDKSEFIVDTLLGTGTPDPGVTNTCIFQELSSAWYKWTCEMSGTLTFTLTPNNYLPGFESDDIDFVVYELPNGIDDCSNKIALRCMASGANTNQQGGVEPFPTWKRCNGPTGLIEGDPDFTEPAGCEIASQNNFVQAIDMVAGKSYALLINNFSQSGLGFSLEWGGTGTFQGPLPQFDVTATQAFECDKTIIFDNLSSAPTDSIVSYSWSFGAGATPLFDNTSGPISVVYESFGPKVAVLTVESEKGCVVSDILEFYVEPCCADTSTLSLDAIITDQQCPGTPSGVIQGVGISGAPDYQYSLDCVDYQPASVFPFLFPGTYTLCVQDEKGCESQIDVVVNPATNFSVEAGDTVFLQLGQSTQLNAISVPPSPSGISWISFNNDSIQGRNELDPVILPRRTGWFVITIMDDSGCVTSDSVLIVVDVYKPIYIPNVISSNADGLNDQLTVYGNAAATGIQTLQIFDRWGGLIWEGTDFPLNDESLGWDGTSNEKPVNPGVYTYRAVVDFLDEIPLTFTGTVTVLR